MLPEKERLGEKISAVIKNAGLTQRQVAEHFKRSPQSVTGWMKTGRITKSNLLELITWTQPLLPPGFWGEDFERLAAGAVLFPHLKHEPRPTWPFSTAEELLCKLPRTILEGVDAQLAYLVGKHLRPKSSG